MIDQPFTFGSDVFPGLAKLVEECGEVLQIAGKLITVKGENNYWEGRDIHQEFSEELADLLAAVTFTIDRSGLDQAEIYERATMKLARFGEWHENGDDPREVAPPDEVEEMISMIDGATDSVMGIDDRYEAAKKTVIAYRDVTVLKDRIVSGEVPATPEQRARLKASATRLLTVGVGLEGELGE